MFLASVIFIFIEIDVTHFQKMCMIIHGVDLHNNISYRNGHIW